MEKKFQNEKLDFAVNIPTVISLDTDPDKAKCYEKTFTRDDGTEYVAKSFMYFTSAKQIFFANEQLHSKLQEFKRGDTITVTKTQDIGQRSYSWNVVSGGVHSRTVSDKFVELADEIRLELRSLRKLILDINESKQEKIKIDPAHEVKREGPTLDEDLGF